MTTLLGEARVRIRPDLTGFLSESQRGISDAGGKLGNTFNKALKVGALAVGGITVAAAAAAKKTLDIGVNYQNSLNTLQAVSNATASQMSSVGATAKKLGNDISLPATSAADAAEAMTELAKASFSVSDAQKAAKGSLQLAAAAQIGAADAAKIQANAIQSFSLKASDAGHVADVLANAANASSAEITDVADAMAQGGSVASSMKIPIEDFAATIGLLANNGIKGSDAGTLLKSAILALQSPSKPATAAMKALGLSAYDAHGNFVGLESIFGQLSKAQKNMTQQAYDSATSTLFGSDAARLAGVAAKTGASGFDTMREAMSRQGSAADVSHAKTKGLGGAIEAFKSQVETFQIDLYQRGAPDIEKLVRFAAANFPKVGESIISGIDKGVSYLSTLKDKGVTVFKAVADYISPLTSRLDDLWNDLTRTNGVGQTLFHTFEAGAAIIVGLVQAAQPLVSIAGDLVGFFTGLPGPVQAAVLAFAALKVATSFDLLGKLTGSKNGVASGLGKTIQSVTGFAQTVRMNMSLADDSTGKLGATVGGLSAAFQQYLPGATSAVSNAKDAIGSSFSQISGAFQQGKEDSASLTDSLGIDADKFHAFFSGIGKASGEAARQGMGALRAGMAGVRSAGKSVLGMLGGPWGLAFTGATMAVGAITNQMSKAKEQTQSLAQEILNFGANSSKVKKDFQDTQGGIWGVLGMTPKMADAKRAAQDLYYSMDPLQRAQADVTRTTNQLTDALAHNPPESDAVASAALRLREANAASAAAQERANNATKSRLQILQEQAAKELTVVNSGLAQSEAQQSLTQAIQTYTTQAKDARTSTDDLAQSQNSIAENALSAAQAAAQYAADQAKARGATDTTTASQTAMYDVLSKVADQLGSETPDAVRKAIEALGQSADSAHKTAAQMKDLGLAVDSIPDSKTVIVDAPTAEQQKRVEDLGYTVTHLKDGKVSITVDTDAAKAAIDAFTAWTPTVWINVQATASSLAGVASSAKAATTINGLSGIDFSKLSALTGIKKAAGGAIHGAGTGTSDSIPAWLSNGEFVVKAKAVAKYGYSFLDAVNTGRYAAGGVVGRTSPLAAARSSASAQDGGFHLHVTVDESKAPVRDQIEEAMFQLRRIKRGGVYARR